MGKNLLAAYRIGGDIIDRVEDAAADRIEPVLPFQGHNSGGLPPESPPAGRTLPMPAAPGMFPRNAGRSAPGEGVPPFEAAASDQSTSGVPPFTAVKDGLFYVITVGGTVYRVGGVKPLFVTSLRVNIRASRKSDAEGGEQSYYDSLDLYSAKARSGFAAALNREWGAENARVEKDLVGILEYLEKERDEQLASANRKPEILLSAEEKTLGLELLKSPDLFTRIVDDLSALGYVGEDLNKELLYLCASSRKLDDPISVLILSQSASGKSFLVDCVRRLMPPEEVVAVTSLSDQALNYIDDLSHKFLVLGEAVHGEVVEHQIREMLSGKELSRLVTIKDAETGKMQSRIVRTPVIVSSVMSGTKDAVNPENASRCFVVNTDESKEQTSRIHEHQRGKYSLKRIRNGIEDIPRIIRTHHAAQRLLEKRVIVNDFAPLLDFPTSLMRLRRDHDRFLDLIACVCFLRQYQKTARREEGVTYIECDLADYKIAYRIMVEGVMSSTVRELPTGAVAVYEELRAWVREEAAAQNLKSHEVSFTQRQVREATGLGHSWVKANLRKLVDYEYVAVVKGGGERFRGVYRLRADEEIVKADLSMIPTPEAMRIRMREGGK